MYYIIIGTLFLIFATCFFVASKVFDYNFTKNSDGEKRFLYATLASFTKALGILFCAISAMVVWNDSDKAECNKEQITTTDTIRQVVYVDSIKTEPKAVKEKKTLYSVNATLTCYNPEPSQCSGDPFLTASGDRIDKQKLKDKKIKWCAVSRDWKNKFPMNSIVEIEGFGQYIVKDLMAAGIYKSFDILQDKSVPQFKYTNRKVARITYE